MEKTETCLSDLSSDILFDILAKLPPKSLFSCRSVSKLWRYIINHPCFVTTHLMNEVLEKSQLISSRSDSDQSLNIRMCSSVHNESNNILLRPSKDSIRFFEIRKPFVCDGFIFFYRVMKSPLLLNPLTRELVELPPQTPHSWSPCEVYGIGFDFKSKVHKVVRVLRNKALVLTLGTENSWREISSNIPNICIDAQNVVTTHGYVHWLCSIIGCGEYVVFSFDIEKEESMLTHYPTPRPSSIWASHLTSWKQSLAMVYFRFNSIIEVWIMKELKSKIWIREFVSTLGSSPPPIGHQRLVGEWRDGFLFETIQDERYIYNPNNHTIEYLNVSPIKIGKLNVFSPNITSLASYGCRVLGKDFLQYCNNDLGP